MLTLSGAEQVRAALGSEPAVYRTLALVDADGTPLPTRICHSQVSRFRARALGMTWISSATRSALVRR